MRTVTLQIVESPSDHAMVDAEKTARRFKRGDIVDVVLTPPYATKTGNDWNWNGGVRSRNLVFIHIRDVPDDRWHNMRNKFREELNASVDPDDPDPIRRRCWRFHILGLTVPKRTALVNDREITLAWTAARSKIRRKIATVRLEPDQDDESNAVLDSDLPGPVV